MCKWPCQHRPSSTHMPHKQPPLDHHLVPRRMDPQKMPLKVASKPSGLPIPKRGLETAQNLGGHCHCPYGYLPSEERRRLRQGLSQKCRMEGRGPFSLV